MNYANPKKIMSEDLPQQSLPVIIKGGSHRGIIATAIEIEVDGGFQVTQEFQSQADDWIQSDSDFSVSYVESVMVGEMGESLQFCQTSLMTHPLTYEFEDDKGTIIFTIKEVSAGGDYSLQISVAKSGDYFHITKSSEKDSWSTSLFDTTNAEVAAVEVKDANNVPVCRLLRANEENIYLNLEPS